MRQRQKAEGQRYLTAKQLQDVLCRQALELRDRRQAEADQRMAEEWAEESNHFPTNHPTTAQGSDS